MAIRTSQATDSLRPSWAIAYALAILVATLTPAPDFPGARDNFFSSLLPSHVADWLDVLANVTLYVPLGITLSGRRTTVWRVCAIGSAMATTIELLQFVVPGRDPSARDIVANTLGACIGSALLVTPLGVRFRRLLSASDRWIVRLRHPGPRTAGGLSIAWALAFTGVITGSALLLGPAPPSGRQYVVAGPLIAQRPGPLTIGGDDDESGLFRGLIDDVRIYAGPRSEHGINVDMTRPVAAATMTPDADLIAAFNFDVGRGSVVRDDSGHGHDAVSHSVSWVKNGRYGGALMFDGRSSKLILPDTPQFNVSNGVTLEAWVFPIGEPSGRAVVMAQSAYYLTASSAEGPYHPAGGGVFGGANAETRTPHPIRADTWTHLAMTYDTQSIRIYVNGTLAVTRRLWSSHQPERISLNHMELPFGPVADTQRLRDSLVGDVALNETLICGPLPPAAAPVLLITSAQNIDAITLLAEGSDLLVRPWTWARRLGLRSPDYRFRGFFNGCAPEQHAELALKGRLQTLRGERDGQEVPGTGLGLGSGWAFLIHSDLLARWLRVTCTLGWLGLLVVPFGYWMRRSLLSVLAAVMSIIALVLVPRLFHIQPLNFGQAFALLCGAVSGAMYQAYAESANTMGL